MVLNSNASIIRQLCSPQANKCRLAELTVPDGDWSHEAILWLKQVVLGADACKMKVAPVKS